MAKERDEKPVDNGETRETNTQMNPTEEQQKVKSGSR
jgi:hypothetical protein